MFMRDTHALTAGLASSRVRVFGPDRVHLTHIRDSDEPVYASVCGD